MWDYYLDRFAELVDNRDPAGIRLEPDYLPGRVPHYQDLIRQAIRAGQAPEDETGD